MAILQKNTTKYSAHGLVFESDIELKPLKALDLKRPTDVTICEESVPESGLSKPKMMRPFAHASGNTAWINVPGIARFQITNGNRISYETYPNSDQNSILLYLLGSAIGAILHQRGFLVLHANAIRMGDGVVVFAGMSGAGKSTTAAAFHQRGYEVISDDIVALNAQGRTVGGFPQIKLWDESLIGLGISKEGLDPIRAQINKYSFPLAVDYQERKLPIKALFALSTANEYQRGQFDISPVTGLDKFEVLKRYTYRRRLMEGLGLKTAHLTLCSTVAKKTPMFKIVRPTNYFNAPELVDVVLNNLMTLDLYSEPEE